MTSATAPKPPHPPNSLTPRLLVLSRVTSSYVTLTKFLEYLRGETLNYKMVAMDDF